MALRYRGTSRGHKRKNRNRGEADGVRPNPLARSLRSQRSNIVGVMVIDYHRTVLHADLCADWRTRFIRQFILSLLADAAQRTAPI